MTLKYAKQWAKPAGISEVTEITHQDCLGVPVFVSVRPKARGDVFTFGKGLEPVDAEVGAYMEAIEYFFAEPGAGNLATHWGTAREVAGSERAPDAILDFAPMFQRSADLDAPLLLVSVHDIQNQDECFLPAELVYYPAPEVGQSLFGASTNGLASGNSVLEASYQAFVELIERDIWSFEFVRPTSILVDKDSMPDDVGDIIERAERNGLQLKVRTIANTYGIPFFAAFLFDPKNPSRKFFNGGWGCDLDRSIALMRAVTEVAQSRLAFIHGGRREPAKLVMPRSPDAAKEEAMLVGKQMQDVSDAKSVTSFSDISDLAAQGSLSQQFDALIACLRRVTAKPIYRFVYTPDDAPLQVVRLVVPLLENFKETRIRIGRRLKSAIDASSVAADLGCSASAGTAAPKAVSAGRSA